MIIEVEAGQGFVGLGNELVVRDQLFSRGVIGTYLDYYYLVELRFIVC